MRLPNVSFTSLAYHIDEYWLFEAYEETSKEKACGVDGVTADEYKENLSTNLKNLLTKMKTGKYFAPPVKRVYIPKGTGSEMRPLGLPTFEDKNVTKSSENAD